MILKSITKRLKLFSILFSLSLLMLPTGTSIQACGFNADKEELRYMIFNPDLLQHKAWWSFFYSARLNYLDGQMASADDEDLLTAGWIKQLNVPSDSIAAWNCLFGGLTDSLLQQNSFYKTIQQQPAAKKYFDVARACEKLVSYESVWEEDERANREWVEEVDKTTQAIDQALLHETSKYYKSKYAFQRVKLAYYTHDPITLNTFYNKYFQNGDKDVLYWWATHYKSMFAESDAKFDSANYLHAKVFSNSSNKMLVSKQFFSRKNLAAVLALAQDDNDRADVYTLAEIINPGRSLENIRKIYQFNSTHHHLPLLISREINKLEDWLGTTKYANKHVITEERWSEKPVMVNWDLDYKYLETFTRSLETMPALAETYPDFYNLSMAYLNLMKGDASRASNYLTQVKSSAAHVNYQRTLFQIILTVQSKDITAAAVQDEIGEAYASLLENREQEFESQKALYSLSLYLRYAFANKGMVYLAGLFDNYALNKFCYSCTYSSFEYSAIRYLDQFASPTDVERLLAIYESPVKNKLERVLLRPYSNKNYLYDLLSVKYLRLGKVNEALTVLKKVPDEFWFSFHNASGSLDCDPFLDNRELLGMQTMVSYNKREIVEKMIMLETKPGDTADKQAKNYFLLGNAWYNFSHNAWFMISYGGGTTRYAWNGTYANYDNIAQKIAMSYYKKALLLEHENENKAKLIYMIAVLSDKKQKREYAKQYEQFSNTDFYANRNCLTLSDLAN